MGQTNSKTITICRLDNKTTLQHKRKDHNTHRTKC